MHELRSFAVATLTMLMAAGAAPVAAKPKAGRSAEQAVSVAGERAHAADRAAILALRAASNRAIAAHDLASFIPAFAEDAAFIWSDGSSSTSRSGLEARFAKDFADPVFVTYIRTPARVAVSDRGVRAVEHGTWTAITRGAGGETRHGGDYSAHWFKTGEGWRIRGELYVKLRCTGLLCTP
jgi:uncharacterized protein (TIGR02246 family)